jgi:hypothetical protein
MTEGLSYSISEMFKRVYNGLEINETIKSVEEGV